MMFRDLSFAWTLLRRDLRAGELWLLAAALVVAVAALSSVGFFVDRVRHALDLQARQLLGGDLVIASDAPLSAALTDRAAQLNLQMARTVNFPSMALAHDEAVGAGSGAAVGAGAASGTRVPSTTSAPAAPMAALSSVKAVTQGYPLRGALRVSQSAQDADVPAQGIPERGTVWVDAALMQALGLVPGGRLQLGEATLRIDRLIVMEPDRGANFVNFAPRALIAMDDLEATGLVQPASRVTHRTMFAGPPAAVAEFEAWAKTQIKRGQRIESLDSGRPELRTTLDRASQFLALVSLLAALIAAVAIAVAARRFAERHLDGCAVMRAMGVTQARLMRVLLLEMLGLGLAAGAAGCALGWLAHEVLVFLAGSAMNLRLPAPSVMPAVQALVAGLLLLLGFAAVPIARLSGVPPLRVLRRDLGAPPVSAWLAAAFALLAFSLLLLWFAGDRKLAGYAIAGFALAAVVFVAAAFLAIRLLAPLRHVVGSGRSNAVLRVALASWTRRQGASIAQTAALSVGLMALMLLTITRNDLLESWQRASPPDAPNRFLINVQPDQREAVAQVLRAAGIDKVDLMPMIRGRLVSINGAAIDASTFENDRARRLVDREFNLSYLERMQPHNRTVVGRWLDPKAQEVSMEAGIMQTLGLAIGDRLTFDIAGEPVEVTAVGARKVAWDSMQVNFFMVLSPAAAADRPQTWISAFHLPPEKSTLVNALVQQFPNLTVFDTTAIVKQIQSILDQVVRAVQFLFLFTLAAGVMVLYAALASSRDERIREAGLMRALGASRAQLQRAQGFELAATGALAGLLAALGALAVGTVLAAQVFQFEFAPRWSVIPIGMVAGAVLSWVAGWLSLRSVVDSPPLATLRAA
jgi:putative ABC transport system permease protein